MARITHILCPVDFSEFSRHAFDRSVGVAQCYGAQISVLHVVPLPTVSAVPFGPEGPGFFAFDARDRDDVLEDLQRFLAPAPHASTPVAYHVVQSPSTPKEIIRQADLLSADLLAMGSHGRSGFDRLILGSVTERVLRTSRVPVMTVPPRATDAPPLGREPFQRILYATDFSRGSDAALRYAASLAQHGAAHLTILHVVEPFPVGYDPIVGTSFDLAAYHAELERAARKKLSELVPEPLRLGCDTDDVISRGESYREILRIAAERQCDLIVLGVHGRNVLDRLVFGSTTERVVRRASCPVLTVRAADVSPASIGAECASAPTNVPVAWS